MAINIKKFIDINITHHETPSVISQRDTAVLITTEGQPETKKLLTSLSEWDSYRGGQFVTTNPYVRQFFTHGGVKLLLVESSNAAIIQTLEEHYIVVAVVGQTLDDAKNTATTLKNNLEGPRRKILVARATFENVANDPLVGGFDNLAIKYSEVIGSEMAIAAYLTRVDIYGTDTVHDYSFTLENIAPDVTNPIDDTLYDVLMSYNLNFNIKLASATRNIGGNLTNGRSLINEFMLIVLHQTVTTQLLNLLVSKIKGNAGLASIRTTLTKELNNYVTNGFLSLNKVWSSEDWSVTRNGIKFNIIKKGTPLTLGYYIQVLPWSSLTSIEIAERQAPPIYIVIADSYGIRKIEVTGEVI